MSKTTGSGVKLLKIGKEFINFLNSNPTIRVCKMSKTTKYICNKCFKSLDYHELVKKKTIIIDNQHKYSHYCPICNNTNFGILSTVIHI